MPAVKKPRPKKFTESITISATPEEKAAWQAAAKRAGRSLSNWLRWIGEQAVRGGK